MICPKTTPIPTPTNNFDEEVRVVDLLPIEQGMAQFGHAQAMSTLTWFEGDPNKAVAILKERADALLRANPWLTGRVQKTKNRKWSLVYNPKLEHMQKGRRSKEDDTYFQIVRDVISREIPLVDLASELKDYIPKNGPDQPLWRVCICPCANRPATRFAAVVSLSHIIGDGHTFFQLANYVLGGRGSGVEGLDPPSLVLDRITTTEEQQIKAMGGSKEQGLIFSPGFISNFLRGTLQSTCLKKYQPRAKIYLVDPDGMEQAKSEAVAALQQQQQHPDNSGETQYVSSNDVLTSWFFTNSNCSHGFMSINWRGRLKGHTDKHAGNYENCIFYDNRKDSLTPLLIRKSICSTNGNTSLYQRHETRNLPLPGYWKMAFKSSYSVQSNWASFACESNLGEGFKEDIQIPLYEVVVPATGAVCVVFRAGPKGLAVIVAGSSDKLEGLEKQVPFLKPYNE